MSKIGMRELKKAKWKRFQGADNDDDKGLCAIRGI